MDQKDILWSMYQEHCTHGRHHESLRATTTNLLLVIAAAAIAVMTRGETPLGLNNLPLALLLIPIGIFGAIFSAKYHERFEMHMERADGYRAAMLEGTSLVREIHEVAAKADANTKKKHPWLFELRLYKLWITLHFLVAGLGLTLTGIIIVRNWSRL